MRVIKIILIGLTSLLFSCRSVKIPESPDRAKRLIEKKYDQIKAISEYHDLTSPNTVKDTVKVVVPRLYRAVEVNSPSFKASVNTAFQKYVAPSLKDGTDVQKVLDDVMNIVEPEFVDKTFEDSLSTIRVYGYPDSLRIEVDIKEREIDKPIEYDQLVVDTDVKWYEDRFIKAAFLVLIVGGVTSIILFLIKKGAN